MSLTKDHRLIEIAKQLCRELRRSSTKSENIFWDVVRNRKFLNKKFYRQYPIFYDVFGKETFYIADFYCHESKLIIEIDGKIHKYHIKQDEQRTDVINYLGMDVVRFKNEDIEKNINYVLTELKKIFL